MLNPKCISNFPSYDLLIILQPKKPLPFPLVTADVVTPMLILLLTARCPGQKTLRIMEPKRNRVIEI